MRRPLVPQGDHAQVGALLVIVHCDPDERRSGADGNPRQAVRLTLDGDRRVMSSPAAAAANDEAEIRVVLRAV